MIYADNAATTALDKDALQAMLPYLTDEYGNASQPYSFSRIPKKALKEARATIANCIGASPNEIYFTSGGTESNNWAIKGVLSYENPSHIITSNIEHHAVLNACKYMQEFGFSINYANSNNKGLVTQSSLQSIISKNTKLVSVMMANNEVGTIQPIKELCEIAHKYGAIFHTDAVQAIGHIPVDVKKLNIDMLSASAHKFNGPKGIGFLYVKNGINIRPYADGGSQEFGMRAGTENVASIVAMSVALQKNCDYLEENIKHICLLEKRFIELLNLSNINYICNGESTKIAGNISLSFSNIDGQTLLHRLDLMGICVSTGSACNGSNTEISHVLKAIKVPEEYAKGTIRISLGKNSTLSDVEKIVNAICKII